MNAFDRQRPEGISWFRRPANLALLGFLAISAFFLFSEHRAHFLGILPYLLLLVCLFLHQFMHRGQKGDRQHNGEGGKDE